MLAAINAVTPDAGTTAGSAANLLHATTQPAAAPTPFSDLIADTVAQVGQLELQAKAAVSGLMTGNGIDVHQAMIATEKANMTFELALAVRNKAVQAYQSVMGMQF
jgi:flagellar hook-basal body complex protein FliE